MKKLLKNTETYDIILHNTRVIIFYFNVFAQSVLMAITAKFRYNN